MGIAKPPVVSIVNQFAVRGGLRWVAAIPRPNPTKVLAPSAMARRARLASPACATTLTMDDFVAGDPAEVKMGKPLDIAEIGRK